MKLAPLLASWMTINEDIDVRGIKNDSRQIVPGDVFLAYPGAQSDGRQFIQRAIEAGAVAVVYESQGAQDVAKATFSVPLIPIMGLADGLATIANQFYGNPSASLSVTGVTGTNGKTTIAYQLAQAYGLLGTTAAYIGTLGQGAVSELQALANTTPDALLLQTLLHQYRESGIQHVCMEVSSHALSLKRVEGIEFNQAIFTNLTHDHLDFHGTMVAYAEAKATLFSMPHLQCAVINHDDAYSSVMQKAVTKGVRLLTYGLSDGADVRALDWQTDLGGSTLTFDSPWGRHALKLRALGRYNLYNALAVLSSLMASEVASIGAVCDVMADLTSAPGRMEMVADRPCVIVDYAHTPDALENVLMTLSALKQRQLWVVFGCGGDRDRAKRPKMGGVAAQHADNVVLTNDNPRSEVPEQIIKDIQQGIPAQVKVQIILDRREAIHHAITMADQNDIILIAGKGHEDYQIIGNQRLAFSDQATARLVIANRSLEF